MKDFLGDFNANVTLYILLSLQYIFKVERIKCLRNTLLKRCSCLCFLHAFFSHGQSIQILRNTSVSFTLAFCTKSKSTRGDEIRAFCSNSVSWKVSKISAKQWCHKCIAIWSVRWKYATSVYCTRLIITIIIFLHCRVFNRIFLHCRVFN